MFPIRHENMSARRWPVITIGLIALNTIIFVFTYYGAEDSRPKLKDSTEATELKEVFDHLIVLAAMHPELEMPADVKQLVSIFEKMDPKGWAYAKNERRPILDSWDEKVRAMTDSSELQQEMDSLVQRFEELRLSFIPKTYREYGFVPAERKPLTYLTANFLHGGWLHLIGNMWFLWLAGFVLEDNWGRIVYTVFYLIAGAAALQFFAWTNPGSMIPLVGASGAVAGLMGAFLVRFPKMKIRMLAWFFFIRFRFSAPAYCLLPLWLLTEIFYGALFGKLTPVAHWAHVGGFIFGGLVACLLRVSHLEHKINQSVEQKTSWTSDPAIDQATDLIERNQLDEALGVLNSFTATHPDSVDAANLQQQIYWRKGDVPAFREASLRLCELHLKAREWDLALQCFQELRNTTEEKLPANLWFDLCRAAENLKNFDLALSEYQQLAAAYPADRQCLMAQIAAGRICLSQMGRPQEALNFFQAADASPVPHLDWEQTIQAGIRNAKAALSGSSPATSAALANR
jgi:membrane associated rhomboid family serine protease